MIWLCMINAVSALLWRLFAFSLLLIVQPAEWVQKACVYAASGEGNRNPGTLWKIILQNADFWSFIPLCYVILFSDCWQHPIVFSIFSSVSFLHNLWDLLFILFFNYWIVIWHLVKWDRSTNEVERVCHPKVLFDKKTVLLQQLAAAKRANSYLAFPHSIPSCHFILNII